MAGGKYKQRISCRAMRRKLVYICDFHSLPRYPLDTSIIVNLLVFWSVCVRTTTSTCASPARVPHRTIFYFLNEARHGIGKSCRMRSKANTPKRIRLEARMRKSFLCSSGRKCSRKSTSPWQAAIFTTHKKISRNCMLVGMCVCVCVCVCVYWRIESIGGCMHGYYFFYT